jgi:hypothetical protein
VKQDKSQSTVREIMTEFARETGLSPARKSPRRYLWTDAFAVCNFLGLYHETGEETFRRLALQLVDQVHDTLGRHRGDDSRTGWISGLDEQEGRKHPTLAGLRIGKELNERGPRERFDERLEWDRDGQYYHYLTKWMHALHGVSRAIGDLAYNTWAIELAKTAHAKFAYASPSGGTKRVYWKMSIDLSRPLVTSMGHHDPLDGFVTYNELQAAAARDSRKSMVIDLHAEIADMAQICKGKDWATDDPLGIGGLLFDAFRVSQMMESGDFEQNDLLEALLESSLIGLGSFVRQNSLNLPSTYRLAFREFGLSIGLRAIETMEGLIEQSPGSFRRRGPLRSLLKGLSRHAGLRKVIETFWLEAANREAESWIGYRDINRVMLATSLAPDGFLRL